MRIPLHVIISAHEPFEEDTPELRRVIRRAVYAALKHEGHPYPTEVSVTLCGPEYIHELNKEYRGVDRPTDVLSFPLYEDGQFDEVECRDLCELGDIVLSLPRAKEQAAELGHGFLREVAFLTVHSTLHLLGYDHERSEEEDELQCRLQKEIVTALNLE